MQSTMGECEDLLKTHPGDQTSFSASGTEARAGILFHDCALHNLWQGQDYVACTCTDSCAVTLQVLDSWHFLFGWQSEYNSNGVNGV